MSSSNTGATGAQIAHDRIDRFRPLGAFGKPVYQSHVQLRAMLRAKRGERAANYFAKPTYDPDVGELRWTAEVPGVAKAWHEMSDAEQADRALELEVVHAQLQSYVRELREQGGGGPGGAASFASLLEQALRVPKGGDFLYFVGDQPVIAFWGFEAHDGASVDPASRAPRYAAATPAVAPTAVPPPAPAAAPLPTDGGRRRRPWWWWLLAALLGLLLLALLFGLLRGCGPAAGLSGGVDGAVPPASAASQASAPEDTASSPEPGGSWPSGMLPGGPAGAGGTGPAPGEPGGLPPELAASGPEAASVPEGAVPPDLPPVSDAGASAPPEPPAVPDAASTPSAPTTEPAASSPAEPPASAPADGQAPATEPPPVPPAASGPGDAAARTPPPVPPLPPLGEDRSMKLPADPGQTRQMGFLEGDWRAGDGLMDKDTQQPVDLSFKFRKDGQGEVTVRRPDGSSCSGPVQGAMSGGRLSIQGSQSVPCSGGGGYAAPKIECEKDRGGQTQCYGVNPDGSKYYMGMQRR